MLDATTEAAISAVVARIATLTVDDLRSLTKLDHTIDAATGVANAHTPRTVKEIGVAAKRAVMDRGFAVGIVRATGSNVDAYLTAGVVQGTIYALGLRHKIAEDGPVMQYHYDELTAAWAQVIGLAHPDDTPPAPSEWDQARYANRLTWTTREGSRKFIGWEDTEDGGRRAVYGDPRWDVLDGWNHLQHCTDNEEEATALAAAGTAAASAVARVEAGELLTV